MVSNMCGYGGEITKYAISNECGYGGEITYQINMAIVKKSSHAWCHEIDVRCLQITTFGVKCDVQVEPIHVIHITTLWSNEM